MEEMEIREYIYHSLNLEGLPYPQNVSLANYNIWYFATVFEADMGVSLDDRKRLTSKTLCLTEYH